MLVTMILFTSTFLTTTFANDGYAAKGAGGIVFKQSKHIKMLSEVLTISKSEIHVKYEFKNENTKSEKALIAFPLPDMSCGYWGNSKQPDNFTILVNNKKIQAKKEIKAFHEDKEVSTSITSAGLPLDCRELEKNKQLFKKAQKANWADDFNGEDPEDVKYLSRITYYWEQEFLPNKILIIEHTYTPILGVDNGNPAWFFNLSPHWDRNVNAKWMRSALSPDLDFHTSDIKGGVSVEYILITAKTWKTNHIDNFKLIIKRDSSDIFVGSTLGPLLAVDKNTFEFRASNFAPDRNITVFFGNSK